MNLQRGIFDLIPIIRRGTEDLISANTTENYTNAFSYDLNNNRKTQVHTGPGGGASESITYSYNADDQLVDETSSLHGLTHHDYDANGSETGTTNGSTVTSRTYDLRNKMVSVTSGGTTTAYVYDDDGNRVREGNTRYLTDKLNPSGYAQPIVQGNAFSRRHIGWYQT